MIQFRIVSVTRRSTTSVNTIHYTYPKGESRKHEVTPGAEWEEIEFASMDEAEPAISVGNVFGDAFLAGQPIKLIINNPKLFGIFKKGDIIPFEPLLTAAVAPSGDPQASPSRTESGKGG